MMSEFKVPSPMAEWARGGRYHSAPLNAWLDYICKVLEGDKLMTPRRMGRPHTFDERCNSLYSASMCLKITIDPRD
jgi:hypothetical protein